MCPSRISLSIYLTIVPFLSILISCDSDEGKLGQSSDLIREADSRAAVLSNEESYADKNSDTTEDEIITIEIDTEISKIIEKLPIEEEIENKNPDIDFGSEELVDDFTKFFRIINTHCTYCHGGINSLHPEIFDFSSLDNLQKWISAEQITPSKALSSPVFNRLVFAPEELETLRNMPYSTNGLISMKKEQADFIYKFINSLSPPPEDEIFEPVNNFAAANQIKSLINGQALSEEDVSDIMQDQDQTLSNNTIKKMMTRWLEQESGRKWLGDFLLVTLDQNGVYDTNRRDRYLGAHISPYNNKSGSFGRDFEQAVFESSRKTYLKIIDENLPFNRIIDTCEIYVSTTLLVAMLYAGDPTKNPNSASKEFRDFITGNTNPADNFDWKLITAEQGSQTIAWNDIESIRAINDGESIKFTTSRCGFFNTLGYHFKNRTNSDNRFRITVSQAFISGLNRQFVASDMTPTFTEAGVDKDHASQAACYSCHKNLDPMTYIFASEMRPNYRPSNVSDFVDKKGFAFRGVQKTANSISEFADVLASHPEFAKGWTERCYEYAGHSLSEDSPGFKQSLETFKASNLNFKELLFHCLGSLKVIGQGKSEKKWEPKTLRKSQFCQALTIRVNSLRDSLNLGPNLPNLCQDRDIETIANSLPETIISRGIKGYSVPKHDTEITYRFRERVCEEAAYEHFDSIPKELSVSDIVVKMPETIMSIPAQHPLSQKIEAILLNTLEESSEVNNSEIEGLQESFIAACLAGLNGTGIW